MNKNVKGAITVIGILAIVATAYHFTHQGKKMYASRIIKLNGTSSSYASLLTMDEGYLKSWSRALKSGRTTFSYNNESYNTQGGKKIVA